MIDINDLISLATSEYLEGDKFRQMLSMILLPVKNICDVHHQMSQMMNLDTATGKTLDLIGNILSVPRRLNFQPSNGVSAILNDDYYRLVLKAKAIKNLWDGTKDGLYNLWSNLFPQNPVLLVDNQNMTCSVVVIGLNDNLSRELILADYILPRPAGVKYEYGFTEQPIFAQDMNTNYLKGFDEGYWLNLTGGVNV